ncbi:MAG TPA: HD domain-containing phosphohydrolase [Pyrinomonadaceae bacterium]|nr:HD domain-containing phosphohydrolase [Pyrinomonadaceae bacterium]
MPPKFKKISLSYFVIFTLLLVGLVPLVLTGWFLSERSAKELRAVEGRYQTQLVQDKARQIEMFGQRYGDLVRNFANALELSNDLRLLSSAQTEQKLSATLKENPNLLAVFVKPIKEESLAVFRSEKINREEIEKFSEEALANLGEKRLIFGEPQKIESNGEIVLPIASPVIINKNISAAVVTIISLREFQKIISEAQPMSEDELLKAGLPIVFVVDKNGNAIFHPDSQIIAARKNLSELEIVQEWQKSSQQIQSALAPFTTELGGEERQMIGAYSTANFGKDLKMGVIVMQDESKALASVGEMRSQTWLISLGLAVFALLVGFLLARQLTSPLLSLVAAAEKVASGDLSTRIKTKNIKEIGTLGDAFNTMSDRLEEHIANLAKAAQENRELFVGTVKALAAAIDGKDHYTRGHSERVSRVSVAIGQRMGLSEEELETLRLSALLHDVGKIAVDDAILKKPAALTDEEFEIMKTHPQKGYKIMSQIPAMKEFLPGIYMHHEMVNGAGYPQGIKGEDIPLQAKIISVADTFDAMTIDRPYQKGMNLEDSLNRIKSFVGTRYDGKVVEALVQACADGQIGIGVVKLRSQTKNPVSENLPVLEKKAA